MASSSDARAAKAGRASALSGAELPLTGTHRDDCAFCQIIIGTRAARTVFEDEAVVAFLDARPIFPGHTLLVPRRHHETLADLPEALVQPLFSAARLLARAVQEALGAQGSFVAMNNKVSQSVPHLHVHIVPRSRGDGLKGFFWPRHPYASSAEEEAAQEAIRAALAQLASRG
jgi:histidine triad (HIT) family protein